LGKSHYQNFEPPFEIPDSWEWVRLDDIAYVAAGSTPEKSAFESTDVPYIKMYNLRNQAIDFEFKPQYIKREVHEGRLKRSMAYSGDLIMNIVGPPLGKLAIIPNCLNECNFNQAAVVIRPYLQKVIINPYLFNYLSEMSEIRSISTKGSAGQDNISLTQSQNMRIALPPLSEQKRIVSSISTWFNIINTIDNSTNRIISNISSLKSKLLDLAISGKLVPQESTDEPAIEALRRINPSFQPCDNPHYQQLPKGWCYCDGKHLFEPMTSTTPNGTMFKYIDIDSVNNQNGVITPKIIKTENAPSRASRHTKKGDILFSMVRPYLRNIGIVPEDDCIASTGFFVYKPSSAITTEYAKYMLLSNYVVDGLNAFMKGDNSPSITKSDVERFMYPVPPFGEQLRIAKCIDKTFQLLDTIAAEL
jgi:type I restriction enzyme S subunit